MTTITTHNPATKGPITSYVLMGTDEAFERVEACHAAFLQWRTQTRADRAPIVRGKAGTLRENAGALAALMTSETGSLLRDGQTEVELCAQLFEYAAEQGPVQLADEPRSLRGATAVARSRASSPTAPSASSTACSGGTSRSTNRRACCPPP